ncbi:hypothetical protein OG883_25535 [Streptomyces sp. NBC_01142]|uniref:hypothetical protein n=1 Tax=Streptomyces sp. NBC_01142 TaxID=2975865 RepID=UPI0022511708|nr:hypothetical protein [Streptomyces sp. NBC_01142]MCX4823190.1 hypothetical protein [Streptomyces sp. NBC_01142]
MSNFVPTPKDDWSGTPAIGGQGLDRTWSPVGKPPSLLGLTAEKPLPGNLRDCIGERYLHVIRERTFRSIRHPRINYTEITTQALTLGLPLIGAEPEDRGMGVVLDDLVDTAVGLALAVNTEDSTLPPHWFSLQDMFPRPGDEEVMSWLKQVDDLREKLKRAYICMAVCELSSKESTKLLHSWSSMHPLSGSGSRGALRRARQMLAAAGVPVEELEKFLQDTTEMGWVE